MQLSVGASQRDRGELLLYDRAVCDIRAVSAVLWVSSFQNNLLAKWMESASGCKTAILDFRSTVN
jgi:hypothetical protein